MFTVVHEFFTHCSSSIRSDVKKWWRLRSWRSYDDCIIHRTEFAERFNLCTNSWFFLSNRNIDTDHILTLLVQDCINSDWCFTCLTVSDNQFTLSASNWDEGINRFKTSLQWFRDWFTLHNTRSFCFNRTSFTSIKFSKSINRLSKRIYNTSDKFFTNLDFISFNCQKYAPF